MNHHLLLFCRKATKAVAVLFPLLGLTNLIFFWNVKSENEAVEKAFIATNAVLQSTQVRIRGGGNRKQGKGEYLMIVLASICNENLLKWPLIKLRRSTNMSGIFHEKQYSRTRREF